MSKTKEIRNTLAIVNMKWAAGEAFKKYREDNDIIVGFDADLIAIEDELKEKLGYSDAKKAYNHAVQSNTMTDEIRNNWIEISSKYDDEIAEPTKVHNENCKPYRADMTKQSKILNSGKDDSAFLAVYNAYVDYKHAYTNQNSPEFSKYVKAWANLAQTKLGLKDVKMFRDIVKRIDSVIGMTKYSTRRQAKNNVSAIDVFNERDFTVMAMNCLYQLQINGNIVADIVNETVEE